MRYYELIYIVNSNIERKKIDKVMKDISSRLENTESKIINHVVWGKKKLAYPIKGNSYGNYILLHYEGGDITEGGALDDNIRHAITKLLHLHLIGANEPAGSTRRAHNHFRQHMGWTAEWHDDLLSSKLYAA